MIIGGRGGREEVPALLSRLLPAHGTIPTTAQDAAAHVSEPGDDGSGGLRAWFIAEHLVDTPLVRT